MAGTMWGKGRTYDEFTVGEKFRFRLPTVTEAYVNNFCCLTGDFNPLHVDLEVARKTIYGERVAPGTLTASLTFTAFAMLVYGTGMALLERKFKFLAPVKLNDTLEVEIEILERNRCGQRKAVNREPLTGGFAYRILERKLQPFLLLSTREDLVTS